MTHVRGFDLYDESQDSVAGSGMLDTGIFERYEDWQAEVVRQIVAAPETTDLFSAGEPADLPRYWGRGKDKTSYDR